MVNKYFCCIEFYSTRLKSKLESISLHPVGESSKQNCIKGLKHIIFQSADAFLYVKYVKYFVFVRNHSLLAMTMDHCFSHHVNLELETA